MSTILKARSYKLKASFGFTLIELLVVIAIIGLLSSIVLASLSTARLKARDASIQSQLSSTRAQAEIYYSNNNGKYGSPATSDLADGRCTVNGNLAFVAPMFRTSSVTGGLLELVQAIALQVNGTQSLATTEALCNTSPMTTGGGPDATAWAMAVKGATAGNFYCVDSRGTFKAYASMPLIFSQTTCD